MMRVPVTPPAQQRERNLLWRSSVVLWLDLAMIVPQVLWFGGEWRHFLRWCLDHNVTVPAFTSWVFRLPASMFFSLLVLLAMVLLVKEFILRAFDVARVALRINLICAAVLLAGILLVAAGVVWPFVVRE